MLQVPVYNDPVYAIFDHYAAYCSQTGARLSVSNGRSRGGRPPKWFVNFDGSWHRYTFRAWTLKEALEIANGRLLKEWEKAKREKLTREWDEFMLIDQQATKGRSILDDGKPDDHARLWALALPAADAGREGA